MTSKSSSWCQDVCHEVKTFVMKSTTRHDVISQKYVNILSWSQTHFMTSQSSLWHQNVHHGVKNMLWWQNVRHCFKKFITNMSWSQKHFMKSQNALWRQNDVMTSIRSSWCKKHIMMSKSSLVMVSKTCYDDKKFVFASKNSSWHVMTSKVCHEVRSLSWSQKLSWSKNMLWRQWHQQRIMT